MTNKKTVGRPKTTIDYKTVARLASVQYTQQKIAEYLNISVGTLQRDKEFCHIYKQKKEDKKITLLENQFKLAETNATMGIWLGKQYLGQKDIKEDENQNYDIVDFKFEIISAEDKTDS